MPSMGFATFSCAVALVCVTAIHRPLAASQESPHSQSSDRDARGQSVRSKSDLRAKTDDEKARARFFDRYGADPLEPGGMSVVIGGPPGPPLPQGAPIPTYDQFIKLLACSTQSIVLGRVQERAVHLNQRETFLFTDYDLEVERWLRPEHGEPSLKLSVDGGRVTIGGRPTIAGDDHPLDPTKRYIFFVEHIPESRWLTPTRPPLADGDPWGPRFKDLVPIPETQNENVRLDSWASDVELLGRDCASGRGR